MSGGHGHGHGVEHGGLVLHPPARWHTNVATGMSALMWCGWLASWVRAVLAWCRNLVLTGAPWQVLGVVPVEGGRGDAYFRARPAL